MGAQAVRFFCYCNGERDMDKRFTDIVQEEVGKGGATLVAVEQADGMVSVVLMVPDHDITVDELEAVSRGISRAFSSRYSSDDVPAFEVTSPGLDRVLKTERELAIFAGRLVRVTTGETTDPIVGILGALDGTTLHLLVGSADRALDERQVTKISLWDEILGGVCEG